MDDELILDPELRRAIDACRPAAFDPTRGDWQLPETARAATGIAGDPALVEIRDRVERLDTAVAAAFLQVPLPEGLADRLLAVFEAVPSAGSADTSADRATGAETAHVGCASTIAVRSAAAPQRRLRRASRRWWVAGGVLAAAVCGVWFGLPLASLDYDAALTVARDFYDHESRDPGKPLTGDDTLLVDYPPFASVNVERRTTTWRWLSDELFGRDGVAYDLRSGGVQATLYVVRDSRFAVRLAGLPSAPGQPSETGGRTIAVWKSDGLVYVLVVNGGAKNYRRFVDERLA